MDKILALALAKFGSNLGEDFDRGYYFVRLQLLSGLDKISSILARWPVWQILHSVVALNCLLSTVAHSGSNFQFPTSGFQLPASNFQLPALPILFIADSNIIKKVGYARVYCTNIPISRFPLCIGRIIT